MFKLKPIITRREEKLIIKYLKLIDNLEKQIEKERKKKVNDNEPLGYSYPAIELSNRRYEYERNIYEILKTIYLDK